MARSFGSILEGKQYYVRCWANLFDKNKNIDWHSHWEPQYHAYHGFYCVNTEGKHHSYTEYAIPNQKDVYQLMSQNGLCVFGKSDGDKHRSSKWLNNNLRVTIAFDVIPVESLRPNADFSQNILHNYIPMYK